MRRLMWAPILAQAFDIQYLRKLDIGFNCEAHRKNDRLVYDHCADPAPNKLLGVVAERTVLSAT